MGKTNSDHNDFQNQYENEEEELFESLDADEALDGGKIGQKEEKHIFSRPRKNAEMTGMLFVLILAACTLVLMIAQMVRTGKQLEESQNNSEQIAQQLTAIEEYLGLLDTAVDENLTGDAEGYEKLSQTVGTLQNGLVQYRDTNEIEDETVRESLNGIIDELSEIQDNIDTEWKEQEDTDGSSPEDGENLEDAEEEEKTALLDLGEKLEQLSQEIQTLKENTILQNDANYAELFAVLDDADEDLQNLTDYVSSVDTKQQTAISNIKSVSSTVSSLESDIEDLENAVDSLEDQGIQIQDLIADESSAISVYWEEIAAQESSDFETVLLQMDLLAESQYEMQEQIEDQMQQLEIISENEDLLQESMEEVLDYLVQVEEEKETVKETVNETVVLLTEQMSTILQNLEELTSKVNELLGEETDDEMEEESDGEVEEIEQEEEENEETEDNGQEVEEEEEEIEQDVEETIGETGQEDQSGQDEVQENLEGSE